MNKVDGFKITLSYDERTGISVEKKYTAWFEHKHVNNVDNFMKDIRSILKKSLSRYSSNTTIDFELMTDSYERIGYYRITFGYGDKGMEIQHRPYNKNDYNAPYKTQFVEDDFKDNNALIKRVINKLQEMVNEQKELFELTLI